MEHMKLMMKTSMENSQILENKVVLGLDTSFHRTGWAITRGMELLDYGFISPPDIFKNTTWKSEEFPVALEWLRSEIATLTLQTRKKYGCDLVAFEDLNIRHVNILKILMQIQAAVKIGVLNGYDLMEMDRMSNLAVKGFLGVPNRKKDYPKEVTKMARELKLKPVKIMTVDAVNRLYGLDLTYYQDDEADAIGLCITALYKRGQDARPKRTTRRANK